ncbi:MAG TPA: TIGR03619 family F420-dependent LLM class oxidoreductase [Chloroflexota bacterium]|nr:TIGR03619 family F420-dependent LLM class oxidoreductase [Chloroflexota bacterium]
MTQRSSLPIRVLGPASGWNANGGTSPAEAIAAVQDAEAAGLDGLFTGDHVTFRGRGNDGLMNLALAAAHSQNLLLQTSVYLLALRHPTPVALQAALIDQLSGGNLILGVGVGGEDPSEWRACGVDPHTRGQRTEEGIQVLRSLWTQEQTTFHGRHFDLDEVQLRPKPLQRGGVPIWIGGRSEAALRRAARLCDGYVGIWISPRRLAEIVTQHAQLAAEYGRADAPFTFGMQFWMGVDDDDQTARRKVAERMTATYNLPFESFERYVPFGSPRKIADAIAPYLEAGATHVNLQAAESSPLAAIEAVVKVRDALRA